MRDPHTLLLTLGDVSYACAYHLVGPFGSNHGSYYYGQLAALQILVYDGASANATIQKYFSTMFRNQVNGTGEQVRAALPDKSWLQPPDI